MKQILASSNNSKYYKTWCDDVKKGYAKDDDWYKYLNTGNFYGLSELILHTEDIFPPMYYLEFMNNPTIESATRLLSSLFNDHNHNKPIDVKPTPISYNQEVVVKGGGLFTGIDPINIYEQYARIDCLHDVTSVGANTVNARHDFAKRLGVSDEVAHMYSTMPKKYTKHICQELLEHD